MSHSCIDRHTDNVTTSARSVHPCSHTSTKTQTPFINCAVNDALVHAMPNMKQTLLQFVDTVHQWLVDSLMDDGPWASLPVTGAQYRRTEAAFASCLALHRPKHHWQRSWWMASASLCLCANKGGHYEHLLWHYQYAYLYNYVTWNVLCCVKYDMTSKAYLRN